MAILHVPMALTACPLQGSRDKVEGADAPGQSMGARDPTGVAAEQGIAPRWVDSHFEVILNLL